MLFNDTITFYHKVSEAEWSRTVVTGVQWSDKADKKNADGVLSIAKYVTVTFPEGTYEGLAINLSSEEDCIVLGESEDVVDGTAGHRISDILKKYEKSGRIRSVNDNSRRYMLKNVKVILS